MSEIEGLINQQQDAMYFVHRALDNFKKIGKANYTIPTVRNRIAKLEDAFKETQNLHRKIVAIATHEHQKKYDYFQSQQFILTHEAYISTSDFMAEILNHLEEKSKRERPSGKADPDQKTQQPSASVDRLPQLNLPTFSGALDEWESFRDRFQAMIVTNNAISEVSKLQYLFSCVEKEPLDIIRNLAITDSNFQIAWNLLFRRYENQRRLITVHVNALLNLPSTNVESKTALNEIRDRANMAIQALKKLGCAVDQWNEILVCLIVNCLDRNSRRAWELQLGTSTEFPRLEDLDTFIETRIRSLEAILVPKSGSTTGKVFPKQTPAQQFPSHATTSNSPNCPLCRTNHGLNQCPVFREKTVSQRIEFVKKGRRCINCLSTQHQQRECKSVYSCQKCRKRHHTLLHFNNANVVSTVPATDNLTVSANNNEANTSTHIPSLSVTRLTALASRVLLATAWINIHAPNGRTIQIRALLDQGSVVSLITENLAQSLKTPRDRVSISITGVGDNETMCKASTIVRITPCKRAGPEYSTAAFIVKTLSNYLPPQIRGNFTLAHLSGLDLADDNPFNSDPVEMIIGADLYGLMLMDGVRKGAPNEPVAQNTTLGWILSGPLPPIAKNSSPRVSTHHCTPIESLDKALRQFWEIEQIPTSSRVTPAEKECEIHFQKTHTRTEKGQYCVRLPFIQGPPIDIGASLPTAKIMWCRQEKRLQADPKLADEYTKFMREYESLNHMVEIPEPESSSNQNVYIPHHAVVRESSTTTRLRVVFNASSKTSNGTSLNDHLLIGQKLQLELPAVILQWRLHRYVFLADIEKMYRQILIDNRDTDYQRIVWRASPQDPLRHFRLCTVTYGTAPAPYLALRVLRQLAEDDGINYPLAVPVLQHQIYVDDCVFGADDVTLARQTRDQLISLLSRAGFTLHKWASNAPVLLSDINPNDHSLTNNNTLQLDKPLQLELKVLGVSWNPNSDSFQFNITIEENVPQTKRTILSTIAKFFDPLGWVTPVVIKAKILMQKLWHLKCDWDGDIPAAILDEWTVYYKQLPCLHQMSLPRWVDYGSHVNSCELHGFADASSSAYAAVVYLKIKTISGDVTISLLTAKSKVAPLKTMSIPRLELCAAVLLSRLLVFVKSTLALQSVTSHCWTDSTIVLAWVSQHSSRWKTFVANRVAEIQTNLPNVKWHHVPTDDNPADCASRGLNCPQLNSQSIWWTGPLWLKLSSENWPHNTSDNASTCLEERSLSAHAATPVSTWDLADRYSSWTKLIRVTAYIFRFVNRLKQRSTLPKLTIISRSSIHTDQINNIALNQCEIEQARLFWLKYIQRSLFSNELHCLQTAQPLPRSSALISLNVYVDENGLIRVGGRLKKSKLPEDSKNPIVLSSHPLVKLLIRFTHLRTLHGGSQLTLATLRHQFWLLRARQTIRSVLYRCVSCARERASAATELMGNLPFPRVNKVDRAFLHCGVDYAGPVLVRLASGRGYKSRKAYIALFICLTTRAIHLELVSDYSTAAFLAALDRFCSRRGIPNTLYSDNGTNFQGAEKELHQMFQAATRNPEIRNKLINENITWNFIPPSAPHFGGLWEAGIRSVKYHLKRVIGAHTLTFEEFATLLCQVEACLNSRPIAPVSDNYDDFTSLTPGHFLIGSALNAIPSPTLLDVRETRLSRWQLLRQMNESFWQAWSTDYLHTLQQRPKWRTRTDLAKPGRIVLIRNTLAPPCKWELGRIIQCHPGSDGITRVVTVKTAQSAYRRPIAKLCFLPVEINTREEPTMRELP